MLASWLTAWSFATLVSRFYALLAGVFAWTAIFTSQTAPRPTDVIANCLRSLDIPPPQVLLEVSRWVTARSESLTTLALIAAIMSVAWSAGFLWQDPTRFDTARGPATLWLGMVVVLEANGRPALLPIILISLLVAVIVVASNMLAVFFRRRIVPGRAVGDSWAACRTLGAVLAGILTIPFLVPLAILSGLGGVSPARTDARKLDDA